MSTSDTEKRGGKRRNSGRKTEADVTDPVKKRTVTLDETTMRMLRVIGIGEISRGIRVSARFTYAAYQAGKFDPQKED